MIPRALAPLLLQLFKQYPILTLLGPRQSGKTTLVKYLFPDKPYVNLEAPDIRALAASDGRAFIERYRQEGAIFDEIQRVPELLSYVQVVVDESSRKGQFVLTGSHQMDLHSAIIQSLAGRTTIQRLLPLSLQELKECGIQLTADEAMLKGGLPRIFAEELDPIRVYRDYVHTYVERDVRAQVNIRDLALFEKFLGLCAGRVGQLLNASGLAGEVGVSTPTIQHWISLLEASYIVFRLHPYYNNFGKRLIKTPKLYFSDVGMLCFLLGIRSLDQLSHDPLRGQLFENMVILEVLKAQYNRGDDPNMFFFRDTHGHEVDLLLQKGRKILPIEIKSGQTFHAEFMKNLTYFENLVGEEKCESGAIIYGGSLEQSVNGIKLLNFSNAKSLVE